MHLPCDLDCVEIFAGVGSIAAVAAQKGLCTAADDQGSLGSLRTAVALVLQFAPPVHPGCHEFLSLPALRGQKLHRGCHLPEGHCRKHFGGVQRLLRPSAGEVKAALVNLGGSHFFKYGPVVDMATFLHMVKAYTFRCAFSAAPFGKRYKRRYEFMATSSWIRNVFAPCRCPGNVHLPLYNEKVCKDGWVQNNGIEVRLEESGAYSIPLGRRIVECACPGHTDTCTQCTSAVSNVEVKRVLKRCIKKSTSAVSRVARTASRANGPVSTARS